MTDSSTVKDETNRHDDGNYNQSKMMLTIWPETESDEPKSNVQPCSCFTPLVSLFSNAVLLLSIMTLTPAAGQHGRRRS